MLFFCLLGMQKIAMQTPLSFSLLAILYGRPSAKKYHQISLSYIWLKRLSVGCIQPPQPRLLHAAGKQDFQKNALNQPVNKNLKTWHTLCNIAVCALSNRLTKS